MNIQSALVRSILEQWKSYHWTVQGFGMVRTKLADAGRIHIWYGGLRVPEVSDVHAHPWELRSTVISGELINQRFGVVDSSGLRYTRSRIATGEGGGLLGEPEEVCLSVFPLEFYTAGQFYKQAPDELHRTIPQDGTVTLLERQMGEPLQETVVLWPKGSQWVSAEPRPALDHEVSTAVGYALARWNPA
jgi:hypothetical protein